MANIITGQSFSAGDQVTSAKLNNIIGSAKLDSDSITGTTLNLTNGELKVATNGITDNELNANSVTTTKIANDAVTYDKIQDVAASSVIGNTTGSTATPTNVSILDEDTMASNSATALATQQSIKAYVDSQTAVGTSKYSTGWLSSHGGVTVADGSVHTITHGLGTTDITVAVFVATNSAGANSICVSTMGDNRGFDSHGYSSQISSLSSNTIVLQLGSNGYQTLVVGGTSAGNSSSDTFASKFIKVVVIG